MFLAPKMLGKNVVSVLAGSKEKKTSFYCPVSILITLNLMLSENWKMLPDYKIITM